MAKKHNTSSQHKSGHQAADLVRQKINNIYNNEPNAEEEVIEVVEMHRPQSKHQKFMMSLTESGKSLAEIQTAWHNYYVALSDSEKHQVWQEFYANHDKQKTDKPEDNNKADSTAASTKSDQAPIQSNNTKQMTKKSGLKGSSRSVSDIKKQLTAGASNSAKRKLKAKEHFQSLLFGVGLGSVVVLILLFGFFNDRFIAPFITPSKSVSATPIIIDGSTTATDSTPKVIIPKINVEIPVVYDEPSIEEDAIQAALERGVVHYATTPNPGEKGNSVIFGHSSNNILNSGKYKFAFVLLSKLDKGDVFYLTYDKVRYSYRIYEKKIVKPTELGVLGATDKPATATLITCDPPGTSLNRLVVIGEQISPSPSKNKKSNKPTNNNEQLEIIPSNAPSLWQRITDIF